jgi:hypothetical protein
MNTMTMVAILLVAVVMGGVLNAQKLRKQIRCRYTSKSKQSYERFVKLDSTIVVFEKKPYYIIPSCVTHHWYTKGMSQLFPQFMPEISFTWESQFPVDPNTGKVTIVDPATKSLMRSQEAMANYAGSQYSAVTSKGGKSGGFEKWMPYIIIALVIAVGYSVYQGYMMKADQNIMKQAISDIFNKIGIK